MAIQIDPYTGWSKLLYFGVGGNPRSDAAYEDTGAGAQYASWFQRSWWTNHRWARKYTNITGNPQRITKMSFLACPGHSNGKKFSGSPGPGHLGPSNGYGCTFVVDLYASNGASASSASSCTLQSINRYNCYYRGYGNTNTQRNNTSFGSTSWFGPNSGYGYDTNGHPRFVHDQIFTFTESAPIIKPGESLYVHVRPTAWASGSTNSNSMLVIKSKEADFKPIVQPVQMDYIWRFDGTQWKRVLSAYQYNGSGWTKIQ